MDRYLTLVCEEEIQSAHCLTKVPDGHKCANSHGHRWKIKLEIESTPMSLPANGMIVDFGEIKKVIRELDHKNLNDFVDNPTCENLCLYLVEKIQPLLSKGIVLKIVEIEESPGNRVRWSYK